MKKLGDLLPGLLLSGGVAILAIFTSRLVPGDAIGATVMALLIGMLFNPVLNKFQQVQPGVDYTGKMILRIGIILMGVNLNFQEVVNVGSYALFVMLFTMSSAVLFSNVLGKMFGINWKLTNLLAVSTAICGGSAVAAVGPVIDADNEDITYAISATFIFDIITVVLFPIIGMAIGMSHFGYGTWIGTAVNDTSSVVAAGYAFSEMAGNTALIVKLTRTLFIIPAVLIFSFVNERVEARAQKVGERPPIQFKKIFPFFIIFFLVVVALRSFGIIPEAIVPPIANTSRFAMVMALSAIGMKTSFGDLKEIGPKPMLLGFIMDTLVVFVAMGVIWATGRF